MYGSGDLFYSLIKNSSDVITVLGDDGTIRFVSPAIEHILGYDPQKLIGTNAFDLIHPDDLLGVRDAMMRVLQNPEITLTIKFRARHKDGSWLITESVGSNQLGNPHIAGIVTNSRDITQRELMEQALRQSEEEYRLLINNIPVVTWTSDSEGRSTFISPLVEEIYGFTPEEIYEAGAELWLGRIHPDDLQKVRSSFESLFTDGGSFDIEYRIRHRKGHWIWIHDKAYSRYSLGGRSYASGVFYDVTERKRVEEALDDYRSHLEELVDTRAKELVALNAQLRQAQKMEAAGLLAGGVAHDFSNILTTIKGSMYIVKKKLEQDSPLMKYIDQVISSADKGSTLSQSLLAFSRKQVVNRKLLDLNTQVKKTEKFLARTIGEHIELVITLYEGVLPIEGDANQIEQVLMNLAVNARDAMPDGGTLAIQTGRVTIGEQFSEAHGFGVPGMYAVISVSDTGTGIDEAIKDKIFDPFFSTKEEGKGSGMGLAVTYGIVRQHNGYVEVESIPHATTFRVYLPLSESGVVETESHAPQSVPGGRETILLAEDDTDTRNILKEVLKLSGYTVLEAVDGEEAVRVFLENTGRIHLVFLDVRMPRKNGRQVYEEISQISPGCRFLFMSGYVADVVNSEDFDKGKLNFIPKSALPDEILRKVREVLDSEAG